MRRLLNVYNRSRAGPWYALCTQPVCGTSIAVGPKSPHGNNMITIDGRPYIDRAGEFVPFKGPCRHVLHRGDASQERTP